MATVAFLLGFPKNDQDASPQEAMFYQEGLCPQKRGTKQSGLGMEPVSFFWVPFLLCVTAGPKTEWFSLWFPEVKRPMPSACGHGRCTAQALSVQKQRQAFGLGSPSQVSRPCTHAVETPNSMDIQCGQKLSRAPWPTGT